MGEDKIIPKQTFPIPGKHSGPEETFQTKANVSNQDTFSIPDICLYPLANVPKAG